MLEDKTDRKPEGEGGLGTEMGLTETGEAGGRKQSLLTCSTCGATNHYNPSWHWVTCWRCGTQNFP